MDTTKTHYWAKLQRNLTSSFPVIGNVLSQKIRK